MESKDSVSQISKTSTLLSNTLKQFNDKFLQKGAKFKKNIQEQRKKLLAQYSALKIDTALTLIKIKALSPMLCTNINHTTGLAS